MIPSSTARVVLHTGCKINLFLHIGPRLPNGYHTLDTLFIPLDTPADTLDCVFDYNRPPAAACSVEFTYPKRQPRQQPDQLCPAVNPLDNTLTKAWRLYADATGFRPAVRISIVKRVPSGAGLGGGSANAAGLLLLLQEQARLRNIPVLTPEALNVISAQVGADVPFFLGNRPALAAGIGDRLTPCPHPLTGQHLVLLCPPLSVNTGWAFKSLDRAREEKQDSHKKALTSSAARDNSTFAHTTRRRNDFEPIVFAAYPKLCSLQKELLRLGAYEARMSGTGAGLFGLFYEREKAEEAEKALRAEGQCFVLSM